MTRHRETPHGDSTGRQTAACPDHGWEACLTRDGRCWVCALIQAAWEHAR